jgi:hypothetical protein
VPGFCPIIKDSVRELEVLEGDGSLADADHFLQRQPRRFVTHVRAIGQVIGAELAHKQLIEKSRFVTGAARGIEDCLIRTAQRVQFARDHGERIFPRNRFVVAAAGTQDHGMSQSSLMAQPVVRLLRQVRETLRTEKLRGAALSGRLLCDRLDTILTVFVEGAILVRVGPGATGAIDSVKLIETNERGDSSNEARFFEGNLGRFENRFQPSGNASRLGDPDAVSLDGRLAARHFDAQRMFSRTDSAGVVDAGFSFWRNLPAHGD